MGQSLSNVMVHFVYSTKLRSPVLEDVWREDFHSYMAGIVRSTGCTAIKINSVEDHVHMLVGLHRDVSQSELMKLVKMRTSLWVREKIQTGPRFTWQRGYGAFSASPTHKADVVQYIETQAEHHRTVSFQEEFVRLLKIYDVVYDEAYVWD